MSCAGSSCRTSSSESRVFAALSVQINGGVTFRLLTEARESFPGAWAERWSEGGASRRLKHRSTELSVDEKSQALSSARSQPTLPMMPDAPRVAGVRARDYVRNGAAEPAEPS